ncbi:MAG: hypothetical protein ACREMC_00775 [Gemmatimonadales bacterium]
MDEREQAEAMRGVLEQRPGIWLMTAAAAQGRALQVMRKGHIRRRDVGSLTEQLIAQAAPHVREAFLEGDVSEGVRTIAALYPQWTDESGHTNAQGYCQAVQFEVVTLQEALLLSAGRADHRVVVAFGERGFDALRELKPAGLLGRLFGRSSV